MEGENFSGNLKRGFPSGEPLLLRFLLLLVLASFAAWILPSTRLLNSESKQIELWGVVRASPDGNPLQGAYVVSEHQVVVTDKNGCFRIQTALGEKLVVEKSLEEAVKKHAERHARKNPKVLKVFSNVQQAVAWYFGAVWVNMKACPR